MFYRIFLYKMFASSIFIFTFATENKYPMYPYADVQICYIAQKHIVKRYISKLALYLYQPIKEKKDYECSKGIRRSEKKISQ